MRKTALFALAALTPLAFAAQALAADGAIATAADAPTNVEALIVTGEITYRNRTEDAAPVLSYDQEYFQRFEPVSAGDAMKRVPSVTFLSDVLESDGARLRGLDPGYTQILINGEKVPGALADRSFFVDRIPAELLDRIEIIRAPSANRSGDAVAGALNIVLRDALTLNGGYVRGGVTRYNDDKFAGNAGVYWGGEVGPGRLLIGANVQGRRAPKEKTSWRYKTPGGALDNIEVQTDVRDGTDYSFNASYDVAVGGGDLTLEGFFVRTDRLQDEDSLEYRGGIRDNANLLTANDNDLDILTDSWSLRGKYVRDMFGGRSKFKLGYSELKDDQFEFEQELEFLRDAAPFPDADRFTRDETRTDLKDSELSAELEHERDIGFGKLSFGVQYVDKSRDNLVTERRNRFNVANGVNGGFAYPAPTGSWTDQGFGKVAIEETRIDPYVMLNGKTDLVTWEVGLRYETTDTKITDDSGGVGAADRVTENDYAFLLPSANFKFRAGDNGRINLSVGRTVRRPNFDSLQPILLKDEYGDDQDFIGNPNLKPETAWGLDLGYERRLPGRGVAGVNVFYRQISDLIEEDLLSVDRTDPAAVKRVYTSKNVGDGKVWGVEFDLSTPLTFIGLENTGVFLNYSWLDSDINDRYGSRRFNSQSNYVFNVGFIQDLPSWEAAFGVTYRKQGNAWSRITLEEVRTEYGGDLEMFIEKRIGERLVVRLTGQNLLDSSKDEVFDKFGSIQDQIDRKHDEYEIETEKAGPVFQLTARYAF
ncbi:TonB-dependent receptor plug domain-containing protein [Caulobacter mirabilis]|uniref:TonB-dependent receptor n=1 Tax=Caulobacter mirabilis TaxID=69666 RepID=A0A2D2B2G2_9CAUL|nr:TonB-dependent receptor [Caulobacter mirabilis]ATQ44455.1 TonB-dependent receptor [Caulobacter mirabilis]